MIEFSCQNCGHKINAPLNQAGLSQICPNCKSVVFIPSQQTQPSSASEDSDRPRINPLFTEHDKLLFDLQLPQKNFEPSPEPSPVSPEVADQIRQDARELKSQLGIEHVEEVQQRKFPWFFDIFLYPLNQAGIIIFAIIVGVPLLIHALSVFCLFLTRLNFPLVVLFVPVLWLLGLIIGIILWLYLLWYLYECVCDSAAGGIRAPETMAYTPSAGELFGRVMRILACFSIFWSPFIWSCHFFGQISFVEVSLSNLMRFVASSWQGQIFLAYAVSFFPMAILRLCTLESFLDALNPVPLVISIFASFLPYCLLILTFCFFAVLVATVERLSPSIGALSYFFYTVEIYLLMIWSHLLGRFYWRYKEKLDWGI